MLRVPNVSSPSRIDRRARRFAGKDEQVLTAATTVFLRDGYERASMDSIAHEAGVSKGTLYSHFDGKEALFTVVVSRKCESYADLFTPGETQARHPAAVLRRFGALYADFLTRPDVIALYRAVVPSVHRVPNIGGVFYEASHLKARRELSEFLQRAIERKELNDTDADTAAELFLSMVRGSIPVRPELGLPPLSPEARDALIKSAVDLFISAYAQK